MLDMFGALKTLNKTGWMDSRSAIGILRHAGTQIPWDDDGDVGILVHEDGEKSIAGLSCKFPFQSVVM